MDPGSLTCNPRYWKLKPGEQLHISAVKLVAKVYPRKCHMCYREIQLVTPFLMVFHAWERILEWHILWYPSASHVSQEWHLTFCLWKVGPQVKGGLRKHVWKLYFLFLLFTLWILCINKDYPRHNSFEYETNMLSFVYVKKNTKNIY